jgi:LAO/AO transport system kinase
VALTDKGLAGKILKGDEKSAARLISLIEDGSEEGRRELSALFPYTGSAHVIGITGPSGAGKSTIAGRVAAALSVRGKKVGVVAIDPTSECGGGAFLADRLRMKDAEKKAVFIRSMAHRGYPGGVARAAAGAVYVLDGLGKDTILVESLGAGQAEKGLFYLCDTVIVLFTPDYGDEIQLLKAGLMEIGDILVVNKGDHPGAEDTRRSLSMSSRCSPGKDDWIAPVLVTRADRGEGIIELVEAIEGHVRFISDGRGEKRRKEKVGAFMVGLLKEELWKRFDGLLRDNKACTEITEEAMSRKRDPYSAVERIIEKSVVRIESEAPRTEDAHRTGCAEKAR